MREMEFPAVTDAELQELLELGDSTELTEECEDLMKGVDIREYSEGVRRQLREAEDTLIEQTMHQGESIAELYNELKGCVGGMEDMENTLESFYEGISKVTQDIQLMQDTVAGLQSKFDNRKAVESELSNMLEKLIIPTDVIRELQATEISPKYVKYLNQLTNAAAMCKQHSNTQIAKEIRPCVNTMTLLLSAKLRSFLLDKIGNLSKPKTNISILQTSVLLRYKSLMTYLLANNSIVGQEVKDTYVFTLGQIYYKKTKQFFTKIMKLERTYLTGKDTVSSGKSDALNANMDVAGSPGRIFSFALRENVLEIWNAPVLIPHIEEEKRRQYPYEHVFRSQNVMLMDIITSEYIFSYDFFSDRTLYIPIFQRVITFFKDSMAAHIPTIHDPVTLIACIRLTTHFISTMEKRSIPCLNGYFHPVLSILWTRFLNVVKANVVGVSEIQKLPKLGPGRILPVVDRFAHLVGNMYEMLGNCAISRDFASEHEDHVKVMMAQIGGMTLDIKRILNIRQAKRASQLFITANLTHVLRVWDELYNVSDDFVEFKNIETWLMHAKTSLVQLTIEHYLPGFVDVINNAEAKLRTLPEHSAGGGGGGGEVKMSEGGLMLPTATEHEKRQSVLDTAAVLGAAETFGKTWATRLPQACKEVIKDNTDALANDLATRLAMQVVIYSERLKKILTRCWLNPPCGNWLVPNQALLNTVNEVLKAELS
eukprot:TRINITY_DN22939_c0_g1_i1.p1 TRINITY_DN22939_c0_g1~~TRINITY_DN22939_c0_g1_i1.p1  ORF type:complete len:710 (+),score=148.51 TRINITY_DN22939_c0_g1_i1:11-2140(+)